MDNPDVNKIGVHLRALNIDAVLQQLDKLEPEISLSLKVLSPELEQFQKTFEDFKKRLNYKANTAEVVTRPSPGQSVMTYYEYEGGGEWCRGQVESLVGDRANVFYTDYGHR